MSAVFIFIKDISFLFLGALVRARDWVFQFIGEDWIFLASLGIIMAVLSFAMDYIIEKMQEGIIMLMMKFKSFFAGHFLSFKKQSKYKCFVKVFWQHLLANLFMLYIT